MVLKTLEAVRFRNLAPTKLVFSPTINIFYGNNAQGKTNLIEAIYLLSYFKSFRAETDSELISWDETASLIRGEFDSQTLSIEFKEGRKEIRLNNTSKRALEVLGELRVASFSPEDILIITGSPGLRRRFIDSLISTINRTYLYNLVHLQKVLPTRNRILQWLREGRPEDLAPWDEQLINYVVPIWLTRAEIMAKLNETVKVVGKKLVESGNLEVVYETKVNVAAGMKKEDLEARVRKKLEEVRGEEIRRATTLIGPQRDDFKVLFEEVKKAKVITKDVGIYGSRGEQRVGILGLKLSELDLIQKEMGERPILLLDDVLSEFDSDHRLHLFSLLNKQQTFITTTDLTYFPKEVLGSAKLFKVDGGVVLEQSQAG